MSSVYDALIKAGKKNETISALSLSWQGISLEWKIMILVLGLAFLSHCESAHGPGAADPNG